MTSTDMRRAAALRMRQSWLVPAITAEGTEARRLIPNRLVLHDMSTPTGRAENRESVCTRDPFVDEVDWERSMMQLLDWHVRTGPARALELCDRHADAQRLRDLPEILWYEAAERPGLLRKYTSALRDGYWELRHAAHAAPRPTHVAAPGVRPSDLTELVRTISFDVRSLLTMSHAGSWARQIFDQGLTFASRAPGFSDIDYIREVDVDLRIAMSLLVDKATWVSPPPPDDPEKEVPR